MKIILTHALLFSIVFSSYGQSSKFKLEYEFEGTGSNAHRNFYPVVKINQNKLTYQNKNGSYTKYFLQESIDPIGKLISVIKDSVLFRSNECIQSGGLIFLSIISGSKILVFSSHNTIDPVALKIINIVNSYLPKRDKIGVSEKLIEMEKECDEYLKNENVSRNKRTPLRYSQLS